MKIGIDVDGVLTDFEWFLDFYTRKMFPKVNINKNEYKYAKRFSCSSRAEVIFYVRYLWWYIRKMLIREGATEVIRRLHDDGHEIYIITARIGATKKNALGKLMRQKLKEWLYKNGVIYDGIYYVSTHNSAKEKKRIAKKIGIEIFIEDDPQNIVSLMDVCRVICLAASYNEDVDVERVFDFQEVYQIIVNREIPVLSYKEREILSAEEKQIYFSNLKKYYQEMPFDNDFHRKKREGIANIIQIAGGVFSKLVHFKVKGVENLKYKEPAIYVCNHRRSMDIAIGYYLLKMKKPRLLIKYEYKGKLLGALLDYMGVVFVDRSSRLSGKQAQNLLIRNLLNGGNILLYPEGTRNRTNKPLLPFKFGAVYIAQVTSCPIIPIVINKISGTEYEIIVEEKQYVDYGDNLVSKKEELKEIMLKHVRTPI